MSHKVDYGQLALDQASAMMKSHTAIEVRWLTDAGKITKVSVILFDNKELRLYPEGKRR